MMKRSDPKVRIAHRDTREWQSIDSFSVEGMWHDGWIAHEGSIIITPPTWARHLRVVANKMHHPEHLRLDISVDGLRIRREVLAVGHFLFDLPCGRPSVRAVIRASAVFVPAEAGINQDSRELSWMFVGVQAAR